MNKLYSSSSVLVERKHRHLILSGDDLDLADMLLTVLKPMAVLTDLLGGEKHITASSVVPTIMYVRKVTKHNANDQELVILIKDEIRNNLEERCEQLYYAMVFV